jgi:UDP-glucose 4-epimerase
VISKFMQGLAEGAPLTVFGDGHQTRDFIYVEDVARANATGLSSDYCGVCNVATETRVDLLRLLEILNECVGGSSELNFAPARLGDIRDSCGSGERLRSELGFAPSQTLEKGLAELADYVRSTSAVVAPRRSAARAGGAGLRVARRQI